MKINFNNKSKLYMIVGICVLCITLLGSSIAYYRTVLFDNLTVDTITHGLDYYINYSKGQNISGATLTLAEDYSTSSANTSITFYKKDNTYDIYGHIYLDVNEIGTYLSDADALKYTLVNNNNVVAEGTLKGSSANDTVLVKTNIPLAITEQVYTLYIWLDENENIAIEAENESLSLTVRCEATMKPIEESVDETVNAVTFIRNLYMNNKDATPVTNNGIEYTYASIYDKDSDDTTSGGLMNDRLGDSEVGSDDGNIRYYGANPLNYIDIGDYYENDIKNWEEPFKKIGLPDSMMPTNSEECQAFMVCSNLVSLGLFNDATTCEAQLPNMLQSIGYSTIDEMCSITPAGSPKLYRIIGLFKDVELADGTKKDLIKVRRNENIGVFSWDQSASDANSGNGINEWNQADLMKLLNPGYKSETVGGSLYWNSDSGSCYGYDSNTEEYTSIPCDFTDSGLSSNVHNKIATVKWTLGGYDTSEVYSDQIYGYERGENVVVPGVTCSGDWCNDKVERQTTWTGKVALAYPSDYGYATDFNSCSENLDYYNNDGCYNNDWMHYGMTAQWLLTPNSSYAHRAWSIYYVGYVNYSAVVRVSNVVFPVLYLNSELGIESGEGTKTNPYVVR